MNKLMKLTTLCFFLAAAAALLLVTSDRAQAQGQTKWIQVGSLHNWYSERGGEIEEGNVLEQQYGLRWPALVNRTDGQAAKGFWMGAKNFTDEKGTTWETKVIQIGPRWNGTNQFYSKTFDVYAQFDPPRVFVDGAPSFANPEDIKAVADTLKSDRMVYNKVTTGLGITEERRIYAFGQQYHDNYHIMDYTFTNTGNPDIGLTAKTLTGVTFYWQFRYAPGGPGPGYEVNNSARWGINAMNDARGFPPDKNNNLIPASENDVRVMFTWLGFHNAANKPTAGTSPNAATFDNIGEPIFNPGLGGVSTYIQAADTNWRLGGAQIAGNGPIYADKSGTEHVNDPNQPTTTSFIASDDPITSNADKQFNLDQMKLQYGKGTEGHAPRHAWLVDPAGKFSEQTVMGNIGAGSPGGWSSGLGYGPYTLAPGQSVRIVWAEGVNGLTFDECVSVGLQYKRGTINTKQKNDSVLSGRLRLFETMRRAVANFNSGFNIPKPPFPPATFNVRGGGDRIALTWDPNPKESANGFVGYRVYRATGRADSTYRMVYQCGGTKPSDPNIKYDAAKTYLFNDVTAIRGVSYYYYITSFTNAFAGDAATRTPAAPLGLESNLFYTRTYDPAFLKRPAGTASDQIRIAPNPYIISSSENSLRFPSEPDKIAFFNIPGNCVISIYTELGELIKQIVHEDGTGDAYWNSITSANQVIVSGVYIVVFENKDTGEKTIKKLVVVR
jgi:hypothetical protein